MILSILRNFFESGIFQLYPNTSQSVTEKIKKCNLKRYNRSHKNFNQLEKIKDFIQLLKMISFFSYFSLNLTSPKSC